MPLTAFHQQGVRHVEGPRSAGAAEEVVNRHAQLAGDPEQAEIRSLKDVRGSSKKAGAPKVL